MSFAWPQLFWLLILPLSLLVWEITRRRGANEQTQSKILRADAGPHSLRLSPANLQRPVARSRARPWLWFGLALAIVAGARPQWGRLEEPVFDQAREILIAIDLSRSMLAQDVKPSRLDRAKLLTQSLLEKLNGERIGLLVFSGTAFLQSPLSADYEILREFLPALNPGYLPEGGTNYRALIDTALQAFGSAAAADRFLIVLSDGEATDENWREQIPELKRKGIRVIGLGVGTAAGEMIPDGSGGLVKDERGAVVLSKLEPATLRNLADSTSGLYQDASRWIDLADLISKTVETGKKGEFVEKNTVRLVERFQWPLALALWCLLVSFYYEFPVRPKPRNLELTPVPNRMAAKTAETLAVFAFALASIFATTQLRAAETPDVPAPPPLAKMVGRLSTTPQPAARDWAEFGRETISWGTRLKSEQQPVPEGPVRDALAASKLGEALDPKMTDWPKLRQDLEALLQKPDQQKENQQNNQQQQKQEEQKQQNKDQQDQQNQNQQDKKKQDDTQKENQSSQQKDEGQSKEPSQDEQKKSEPKQEDGKEKQSAFGDMKNRPPPLSGDTQKVGGAPEKKEGEQPPADPALALPLQKLEQLRNQDSPAELFKLIEGDKAPAPRKKTKDW